MDGGNEVNKIFIVSLRLIGRVGKETCWAGSEMRPATLTNRTARTKGEI